MAEDAPAAAAKADPKADAPAKPPGKLGGAAKVGGLVLTVMLIEAGVLWVLLAPAEVAAVEQLPESETEDLAEVSVDEFSTTNARAVPGRLVHLTFTLTAVVPADRTADFERAVGTEHSARVREAVLEVARAAGSEDLDDPRLTDFKRDLADAVNTVLREDLVRELAVSQFKALEQ